MARTDQKTRGRNGRYLKITVLNKVKSVCNRIMFKIDALIKSLDA